MPSYLPAVSRTEPKAVGPWFIPAIVGGVLLVFGALATTGRVKLRKRGRR